MMMNSDDEMNLQTIYVKRHSRRLTFDKRSNYTNRNRIEIFEKNCVAKHIILHT